MDCDFFTYSGWVFGLISLIFGIVQLFQKRSIKKKFEGRNNFSINGANNSNNYQAQEQNINIDNSKK